MSVRPPSYVASLLEFLRGRADQVAPALHDVQAELAQMCGADYVSTRIKDGWVMPRNAIVVQGEGGPGRKEYVPIAQGRYGIRCYSAEWHTAEQMAGLVALLLHPVPDYWGGWSAANVTVISATASTPHLLVDPDTKYRYAYLTGVVTHFLPDLGS